MFTDTYRLIQLRIDEAHHQADLERMTRATRAVAATGTVPADRTDAPASRPADAALMAAGERSDALLRTVCCVDTADRAA